MGWASAGQTIFDPVIHALIEAGASDEIKATVAHQLIEVLRENDWDTEDESLEEFADDPVIVAAFAEYEVYLPGTEEYDAKWRY